MRDLPATRLQTASILRAHLHVDVNKDLKEMASRNVKVQIDAYCVTLSALSFGPRWHNGLLTASIS